MFKKSNDSCITVFPVVPEHLNIIVSIDYSGDTGMKTILEYLKKAEEHRKWKEKFEELNKIMDEAIKNDDAETFNKALAELINMA